jgi:hypothetical protein
VVAILKIVTSRNFSMTGINTGHHNLPTFEMALKSENVEFLRYCGGHHNIPKYQHFPISSQFDMWVDNDVPN